MYGVKLLTSIPSGAYRFSEVNGGMSADRLFPIVGAKCARGPAQLETNPTSMLSDGILGLQIVPIGPPNGVEVRDLGRYYRFLIRFFFISNMQSGNAYVDLFHINSMKRMQ